MLYQLALSWSDFTGGSNGLAVDTVTLLGTIDLSNTYVFYYLALVLLVVCYYLVKRIMDSPFGLQLKAIRESERRAKFVGYNTDKAKRRIFAISGAVGGVAGALFTTRQTFTSPDTLYWIVSGDALFAVVLGGVGTLYGPIIGGAVLLGLDQALTLYFEYWRLILGLVLIGIVLFAPRGLVSFYYIFEDRFGDDEPPGATAASGGASDSNEDGGTQE
jgi:branched-chain amino acid transport system permease protein